MFRIPPLEILAHFEVGAVPKALEIVRDLLRPIVGREEMHQDADAAARDRRRLREAEELLDARGENGCATGLVVELDPGSARHLELLGRIAFERGSLRMVQLGAEECDEVL